MLKGNCHCGAISFELDAELEWLTECNCSICRRLGTIWAHARIDQISIHKPEGSTTSYRWGDENLAFHTCKTCGCTTHWENLQPQDDSVMAVNVRLVDPVQTSDLRIRRFDGADSWQYLD